MILAVLAIGYQCIVPINQNVPGTVIDRIPELGVKLIHSPVKVGQLNETFKPDFDPNDPTIGYHVANLNFRKAWDFSRGSNVVVAVVDTGFDLFHEDLAGQWVSGRNVASDNSDVSPVHPHGTRTASTIGAIGNNLAGIVGGAFDAKIMPIRVTNNPDGTASAFNIAKAITYAANNGARLISISYGVASNGTVWSAIDYANSRGSLGFCSLGNQNVVLTGDNHPGFIGVMATDENNNKASFSNTGEPTDYGSPGTNIWVANPGGGYQLGSGTSYACPLAAAVAACALSANLSMTWQQIEECLRQCDDLGPVGYDQTFGWGILNAEKAVNHARSIQGGGNEPPPPDSTPPTIKFNSPVDGLVITQDTTVAVSASASDNVGVTKVIFWMNQFQYLEDTTSLYGWNWTTQAWADGPWKIRAVAYDEAGNSAEASVTVTLSRSEDTQGPTITVLQPTANMVLSNRNRMPVEFRATDASGVAKVRAFLPSGIEASKSNPTELTKWNMNIRAIPLGSFVLTIEAWDGKGNKSVATVNVEKR